MKNRYYYDPKDDDNLLDDDEKILIRDASMNNTYTLITNGYDFDVFHEKLFWLLTDYQEITVFDVLIDYFQHPDREEYEKCAILRDIKKELTKDFNSRVLKKSKFTYTIEPDDKGLIL